MKKATSLSFDGFSYCLLFIVVFFLLSGSVIAISKDNNYSTLRNDAYAHLADIPGAQSTITSKSVGSYNVLFQTIPSPVHINDNSTLLRFSIMQNNNNQDIYGVYAALTIKERGSDRIDTEVPYKFYEFGDLNFKHTFDNATDHEVILQARIAGDQQYQNNPLVASFDVPVLGTALLLSGTTEQIIVLVVLAGFGIGMAVIVLVFNKRMRTA
jgi:hypothetical protein